MNKIIEASKFILDQTNFNGQTGFILGSGLGGFTDVLTKKRILKYLEIPNYPQTTVEGHKGELIIGKLDHKDILVANGRFHLYEGYDFVELTYPIRVMHALGINKLLVSNAAGAINPDYRKGDLLLIDDHINLQGGSPLAFSNVSEFGPRFVDMICPYNAELSKIVEEKANSFGIKLHRGVYAAVIGPQLETRAEYRMLRILGADAVGMSTVPEVIVANQLNLPVIAISVLTDECDPDHLQPINVPEIMEIAKASEPNLIQLFKSII